MKLSHSYIDVPVRVERVWVRWNWLRKLLGITLVKDTKVMQIRSVHRESCPRCQMERRIHGRKKD